MALTKKWAANGIKSPIPNDPQGDNLVNYDEGFTTLYRTPIKDGGKPIGLDTFNQLMYDITDEVIENKGTLNQVAQRVTGLIDDTQTSLTATWSSQLIDSKLSAAAANIIDDSQTTGTLTWSSLKISAEIGQGGGGSAVIDDNTITTDKVWSSFKTNQMVKGGKTISITNFQTKTATADTEFVNNSANAQVVNLNVKVKTTKGTTQGSDKYLGDIVVYYNSTAQEVLRESVISQNITGAPNDKITSALGSVILDAQDTLLVKGVPDTLWADAELESYTANITTEAPEPQPLGEGLIFTAQASNSSVTFSKQGTPTELQLEYQTIKADVTSGWQSYTLGTTIDLDANDKVTFRNTGTQTITQTASNYHYFTMAGEIKPENSISFLFDSTGTHDSIGEYECYKMFANCSALAEMPDLPATNIAANGYANMFEGCTKLKTIKPLNATTITNYSYKEMFKNCSGLIISEGSGENQFLSMPASAPSNAGENMFIGTGGRFTGTPTANSSYFYNATLPATTMLRFTAEEAGSTISFKQASKNGAILNLEYRTNANLVWQDYVLNSSDRQGPTITLTNIGDWMELRNKGLQKTPIASSSRGFSMTGKIAASGNIMYLLDKTGELKSMEGTGFRLLFGFCGAALTTPPDLPATELANHDGGGGGGGVYESMFKGCTSLRFAPDLPATDISNANGCYSSMFSECSSLVNPPKIAAKNLSIACFGYMFANCSSLKTAPDLPVNAEMKDEAYREMFKNCSSLTTIPNSLPATTLKPWCYNNMFAGCTSLTTAPAFPNSFTLADMCCNEMFKGCSNLKVNQNTSSGTKIFQCPSVPYSSLYNEYATQDMFLNTGGTFTGTPTQGNTYNWYN